MSQIKEIKAREIIDSRGNPTVEAEVILLTGEVGLAAVPSGASTGSREAMEKRDQDKHRYLGKGVMQAVSFIRNDLSKALKGFDVTHQTEIDETMLALDGTANKEKYGANALLAVSLAAARAAALTRHEPLYKYLSHQSSYLLPVPMMNIINGGAHADNNLDFQEFMILPIGATSFSEALRAGVEIFHHLKQRLKARKYNTNVGDEGGFAPDLPNQEAAIELILEAIIGAGYQPEKEICLGLDVASNELYRDGKYHLEGENRILSVDEFIEYLAQLVDQYPIISIEDGMAEDDWEGWGKLSKRLSQRIQLVGDDLFVTNTKFLQKGITQQVANAILIKQIRLVHCQKQWQPFRWQKMQNIPLSFLIAQVKQKIPPLQIVQWEPMQARSRRDHYAALTGLQNIINCFALKKSSAARENMQVRVFFRNFA